MTSVAERRINGTMKTRLKSRSARKQASLGSALRGETLIVPDRGRSTKCTMPQAIVSIWSILLVAGGSGACSSAAPFFLRSLIAPRPVGCRTTTFGTRLRPAWATFVPTAVSARTMHSTGAPDSLASSPSAPGAPSFLSGRSILAGHWPAILGNRSLTAVDGQEARRAEYPDRAGSPVLSRGDRQGPYDQTSSPS